MSVTLGPGMSHPGIDVTPSVTHQEGGASTGLVEQSQLVPFGKSFSLWKFLTLLERKQKTTSLPPKIIKKKKMLAFPKNPNLDKQQIPVPFPGTGRGFYWIYSSQAWPELTQGWLLLSHKFSFR